MSRLAENQSPHAPMRMSHELDVTVLPTASDHRLPVAQGSPLRVAILSTHLRGGGKETFVVHLANTLAALGHLPRVICFDAAGKVGAALAPGVSLVELRRAGNDPRLVLELARLLQVEDVDVVHSNNWGTLVEAVLATWRHRIPVVHTQHGLGYEVGEARQRRSSGVRGVVLRAATRRVHSLVAVSPEVGEMMRSEWKVPAAKVHVITNGVPVGVTNTDDLARAQRRRDLGLVDGDFAIASVGYLRPVKNFPVLVRAVAALRSAARARLFIIGVGPSEAEIRRVVTECGAGDRVTFLGRRADVPALLPLFDAFALASESEGISISILEAMAAGLPVVATDVGGNPVLVDEGVTGLLVPAGGPDALANALDRLAASSELRSRMGAAATERVRARFSIERMTADYLQVFRAAHASGAAGD